MHEVAAAFRMGHSAEDICAQNPGLDPSLLHVALAYYFAHKERIDAELLDDERFGAELAARHPEGITPENFQP